MKTSIWLRTTIVLLVLAMMPISASAKNFKWRLQTYEPKSSITAKALQKVADQVRQRTDGAFDITIFEPGVLGYSGWGVHRVVSNKQLEMAEGITAAITEIPAYGIFDQPFFTDLEEAKIAWDLVKPGLDKAAQSKMGLKLLSGVAKPMAYWVTKKPMETVDDIKGMKIRAWNLALTKWVERMGGVPYSIPYSDLYTSLATGVIEANSSSPVSVLETKIYEVTSYFNLWPSGIVVYVTFVNLDKFNSLPAEYQQILVEEAEKAEQESWIQQADAVAPALTEIANLGIKIIQPSKEELAKSAVVDQSVYNEWMDKAPEDVQQMVQQVITKLGK